MLQGGTRGPALVAGDAGASLLYRAAAQTGDLKMPPGKPPLAAADLAILRQWIDSGAPGAVRRRAPCGAVLVVVSLASETRLCPRFPNRRGCATRSTPSWPLSLKPKVCAMPPPPTPARSSGARISTSSGSRHPPEKVEQFVHDTSPDAWEKLVDELLASPQYGERWARHWLDVARYADSGGFETDIFYPNAWRYRDYVIKSFNEDKPYDRFLQEQIAGDELWPDNLDLLGTYQVPPPEAGAPGSPHRNRAVHPRSRTA